MSASERRVRRVWSGVTGRENTLDRDVGDLVKFRIIRVVIHRIGCGVRVGGDGLIFVMQKKKKMEIFEQDLAICFHRIY